MLFPDGAGVLICGLLCGSAGASSWTSLLIVVAIIAILLALGISVLRLSRRDQSVDHLTDPRGQRRLVGHQLSAGEVGHRLSAREAPLPLASHTPARRICAALYAWLTDGEDPPDLWTSFDQLIRELLTEHLGATRVRCYHVRPGCETLQTLSQTGKAASAKGPSAREGVVGHAVTTGREYVEGDRPLSAATAPRAAAESGPAPSPEEGAGHPHSEDSWTWVWPVRENQAVIGVVAVANLRDPTVLSSDTRQNVGQLLSLCWQQVACLERLRVLRRTDPASGVLTRNDFFTLAGHALSDSYRGNEPVVVGVLVLEGLRRLDDTGHWRQRDALIEQVGQVVVHRVRSDDLIGRFADDRFVVLLRRLDGGLGRLIAEKILATVEEECLAQIPDGNRSAPPPWPLADARGSTADQSHFGDQIRARIGLVGSGMGQPSLETLLVTAFKAAERARYENLSIATEGEGDRPTEEGSAKLQLFAPKLELCATQGVGPLTGQPLTDLGPVNGQPGDRTPAGQVSGRKPDLEQPDNQGACPPGGLSP
jgi:GGDEF domain-containing protein